MGATTFAQLLPASFALFDVNSSLIGLQCVLISKTQTLVDNKQMDRRCYNNRQRSFLCFLVKRCPSNWRQTPEALIYRVGLTSCLNLILYKRLYCNNTPGSSSKPYSHQATFNVAATELRPLSVECDSTCTTRLNRQTYDRIPPRSRLRKNGASM